jgi:hypothetical protein
LDVVRISGRLISVHILERLSARSTSDKPPDRRTLVRDFCQAVNWRNRRGQLCLATANVALNRLEKQGLVRLSPPQRLGPSAQPRRLRDDQEALPALPKVSPHCALSLQLIEGQSDPQHLLWNRLIIREHPLKDAPLVGSQLRYLIHCPEGIIGAFGIGPAAFHLACRDSWIGWDTQTRKANLSQVIGLSRFLIRPGIRCANMASRCYSLLLRRVAQDWEGRYRIKPVLIETFVDRALHHGRSLGASNWRRLGQSSGRGRSTVSARVLASTVKEVWIHELHAQARPVLLRRPEPLIPARSLFQAQSIPWSQEELDGLDLGDSRLNRRLPKLLDCRWNNPQKSFARSFETLAQTKAAYRLVESPEAGISFQSLLAPHQYQTQRRMAAETVVLLPQDTTTLSYNSLAHTQGLGQVGDKGNPGRGLLLHSMQAFRLDGIPLGNAWAKIWARPYQGDCQGRNQQSLSEKESVRWIEAYQAAAKMARSMPQTHLVICGDRESDSFDLFDQTPGAPPNLHALVRANHDRLLNSGEKLWDHLWNQPIQGTMEVRVPRRKDQPARAAILQVRWAAIEMAPPQVTIKRNWQPLRAYAVFAHESNPPAGVEPIHWVLLTDWKVQSLKMALRMIQWYSQRWGIECWHQVLKDVCKVEKRQMKSDDALQRALVLDMIVAWRVQMLVRLGKDQPDLPAALFYAPEELAVLEDYKKKRLPGHARDKEASQPPLAGKKDQPEPSTPALTVFQANLLVAMLAGFLARKGDGHPGAKLLAEGMIILAALVEDRRIVAQNSRDPLPKGAPRPREPG